MQQAQERPAISIHRGDSAFSRIGGLPQLPANYPWPADDEGKPLAFLCQIALTELPHLGSDLGFPEAGALFFFYCQDQSVWGFDPKDHPNWRVLYAPEVSNSTTPRTPPAGMPSASIYRPYSAGFSTIKTYPESEDEEQAPAGQPPFHMMGGYPFAIQNPDMEDECQLASQGIYLGNGDGHRSPEGKAMLQEPNDWTLLLQFDSDDDAGVMWGDSGILYFWVRRSDLAKKDFSKVWMILQCC